MGFAKKKGKRQGGETPSSAQPPTKLRQRSPNVSNRVWCGRGCGRRRDNERGAGRSGRQVQLWCCNACLTKASEAQVNALFLSSSPISHWPHFIHPPPPPPSTQQRKELFEENERLRSENDALRNLVNEAKNIKKESLKLERNFAKRVCDPKRVQAGEPLCMYLPASKGYVMPVLEGRREMQVCHCN